MSTTTLKRSSQKFIRDERGNVAITFGLMIIPIFGIMGAAIDYSRAVRLQSQLQTVLDGATLAGLQAYRSSGNLSTSETRMLAFIDEGLEKDGLARATEQNPNGVVVTGGTFDPATSSAYPTLTAKLDTLVLGIIGVEEFEVSASTEAAVAGAQTTGTKALELSLMLDLSGSMEGQKFIDMKAAAKDFLNVVMPDDLAVENRKVGIVPFSAKVNAGEFADDATGLAETMEVQNGTTNTYTFSTTNFSWKSKKSCGDRVQSITAYANLSQSDAEAYCVANFTTRLNKGKTEFNTPDKVTTQVPQLVTKYLRTCISERQGDEAYTDAAPSTSAVGWYSPTLGASSQYNTTTGCTQYSSETGGYVAMPTVKALTTDKEALSGHIDTFEVTFGGTAGHLATAWAWYMLSPLWNTVWPPESDVVDYDDAGTIKAAVLMTDGEYNSSYADTSATEQALQLCTNMKLKGITVYTIGFDMAQNADGTPNMSNTAVDLLSKCASPGKYYFPYSGDELREAFTEIGNQLVTTVTTSSDDTEVILQQ